jgi:uncharacterized membrane protein YdbT with pleckstrin-like domain
MLDAPGPTTAASAASQATLAPADRLRARHPPASQHDDAEHELWHGSYSPKALVGSWLIAVIVTLAAVVLAVLVPEPMVWIAAAIIVPVVWLAIAAFLLYERMSVEYTLTNQRFIHKHGLVRRITDRIETIDINDVRYEQGPIERMFGVGTIRLLSNDASHPELVLPGIDPVQHVATLMDNARRQERRKRGLYMES